MAPTFAKLGSKTAIKLGGKFHLDPSPKPPWMGLEGPFGGGHLKAMVSPMDTKQTPKQAATTSTDPEIVEVC